MLSKTCVNIGIAVLAALSPAADAFTNTRTHRRQELSVSKSLGGIFDVDVESISRRNHGTHLRMSAEPDEEKKETTWDRITGPKLFKTVTNLEGIHSVPLVPLRIMTGLLMVHHGSEGGIGPANFGTPEFQGFVDYIIKPYFSFLPGSPELWSAIHDYAEFYGGIFFALGFLTRPVALSLLVTMLSAVYFHLSATGLQGFPLGHVSNYSYDFEEPLLYSLIFLFFWFNGAGPASVDSVIYGAISEEEDE